MRKCKCAGDALVKPRLKHEKQVLKYCKYTKENENFKFINLHNVQYLEKINCHPNGDVYSSSNFPVKKILCVRYNCMHILIYLNSLSSI